MKFQPKTKTEIAEAKMWEAGVYPFEIIASVPAVSKKGAAMITVTHKVMNDDGGFIKVYDYLMTGEGQEGPAQAFAQEKLFNICETTGLLEEYKSGELLPEQFIGRSGHMWLKQGKEQNGYAPKNEVGNYIVKSDDEGVPAAVKNKKAAAKKAAAAPIADDSDIPF